MTALPHSHGATDDYFRLVRAFPLRPIRNAGDYAQAGKVLNRLLGRSDGRLTRGQKDYLDALALLVKEYDQKHSHFLPADLTPTEALKYLVEQAGMGPTALAKVLGTSHAMASLMLHGKRGISADAARALARYFKVDTGLFV